MTSSLHPLDEKKTTAPVTAAHKNALSLGIRGLSLFAAVAASIVAFVIAIPESNDYARASIAKHTTLSTPAERKIVLVGGSNLSFGIDSSLIHEATGCPVANMGINGYFGVKYMLNEVRPHLGANDVVVIAWEYDSFVKSVDGDALNLLVLTKANPDTFRYLDGAQLRDVALAYPHAAQQKFLRLMGDARQQINVLINRRADYVPPHVDIVAIESADSFNAAGDIVAHIGLTWPDEVGDGIDLTNTPRDPEVIPMMETFARSMESRGVAVMTSFSPVMDRFYADHKAVIDAIGAELQASPTLHTPSPASNYVFAPDEHFDTVYHLNGKGRERRSRMLVADLLATFGDRVLCRPEKD